MPQSLWTVPWRECSCGMWASARTAKRKTLLKQAETRAQNLGGLFLGVPSMTPVFTGIQLAMPNLQKRPNVQQPDLKASACFELQGMHLLGKQTILAEGTFGPQKLWQRSSSV